MVARREVGNVPDISDRLLGQILVSANASLTRQGAALFLGVTAVASLMMAGVLTAHGFWPVLPFAGLGLFALGMALGMNMRRGRYREFVSVYGDRIVVERGVGRLEERFELPRHWTQVERVRAPWRGHPSRLLLRCHGKSWEVGAVLTETERDSLAPRLAELVAGRTPVPATGTRLATNDSDSE